MSTKEQIKEVEFKQLVAETESKNFVRSKDLSKYIVDNKLGYKYRNISGILEMEMGERTWEFKGGFPPRIYARLCYVLGLKNEGSAAKPNKFTSYDVLLKSGVQL